MKARTSRLLFLFFESESESESDICGLFRDLDSSIGVSSGPGGLGEEGWCLRPYSGSQK